MHIEEFYKKCCLVYKKIYYHSLVENHFSCVVWGGTFRKHITPQIILQKQVLKLFIKKS